MLARRQFAWFNSDEKPSTFDLSHFLPSYTSSRYFTLFPNNRQFPLPYNYHDRPPSQLINCEYLLPHSRLGHCNWSSVIRRSSKNTLLIFSSAGTTWVCSTSSRLIERLTTTIRRSLTPCLLDAPHRFPISKKTCRGVDI